VTTIILAHELHRLRLAIRAASRISFWSRADFDMRGKAISLLTLARTPLAIGLTTLVFITCLSWTASRGITVQ
jgi:hypothetical protein